MKTLKQIYEQKLSFIDKNDSKIELLKSKFKSAANKNEYDALVRTYGLRLQLQQRLKVSLDNLKDDIKHAPKYTLIQDFKNKLKGLDLSNAGERKQLSHEIKKLDEELKGNGATHDELLHMGWCELYFQFS